MTQVNFSPLANVLPPFIPSVGIATPGGHLDTPEWFYFGGILYFTTPRGFARLTPDGQGGLRQTNVEGAELPFGERQIGVVEVGDDKHIVVAVAGRDWTYDAEGTSTTREYMKIYLTPFPQTRFDDSTKLYEQQRGAPGQQGQDMGWVRMNLRVDCDGNLHVDLDQQTVQGQWGHTTTSFTLPLGIDTSNIIPLQQQDMGKDVTKTLLATMPNKSWYLDSKRVMREYQGVPLGVAEFSAWIQCNNTAVDLPIPVMADGLLVRKSSTFESSPPVSSATPVVPASPKYFGSQFALILSTSVQAPAGRSERRLVVYVFTNGLVAEAVAARDAVDAIISLAEEEMEGLSLPRMILDSFILSDSNVRAHGNYLGRKEE